MKTERMYENLQARYRRAQKSLAVQVEEEKANKERQEEEAKIKLNNILSAVLADTKKAIEEIPSDMLYEVYEKVKNGMKKNNGKRKKHKDNIYIECSIEGKNIHFDIICNKQEYRTSEWGFDFDKSNYDNLCHFMPKAYPGISFESYWYKVRFFLSDETLHLKFHLTTRKIYEADDEEEIRAQTRTSVKRFTADVKEFFPEAEIRRVGRKKDYLDVAIKL